MGDEGVRVTGPAWARVGHAVGRTVGEILAQGGGMLVVEGRDGRYVQFHAVPGEGFYAEADSGEFTAAPVTETQRRRLAELGWSGPDESVLRPGPANHWLERDAPFDLYAMVLLLLGTLAEVFGSAPDDVRAHRIACVCGHGPPQEEL